MTRRNGRRWLVMVLGGAILTASAGCSGAAQAGTLPRGTKAVIIRDASLGPVRFAANEVAGALMRARYTVAQRPAEVPPAEVAEAALAVRFVVGDPSAGAGDLSPQGYALQRTGREIRVTAPAAVGAMYGGLDLAETIRLDGLDAVREKKAEPFIARRGVKFNIPLDARTPSYDDSGDAAQQNIATMWQWDFWENYLDEMARNRYNVLTLWTRCCHTRTVTSSPIQRGMRAAIRRRCARRWTSWLATSLTARPSAGRTCTSASSACPRTTAAPRRSARTSETRWRPHTRGAAPGSSTGRSTATSHGGGPSRATTTCADSGS